MSACDRAAPVLAISEYRKFYRRRFDILNPVAETFHVILIMRIAMAHTAEASGRSRSCREHPPGQW
jgi:hypothetical protein